MPNDKPTLKITPDQWVSPKNPQLLLLRNWQAKRLATSHADLQKQPRYYLSAKFFFEDIYSPTGFSELGAEVDRIYRLMSGVLSGDMLLAIQRTHELYQLSEALDQTLLYALTHELGLTDNLTVEMYAQGYRLCDNTADRIRQLELTQEVGERVEKMTNHPMVGMNLTMTHIPAKFAGWGKIHSFLERGYKAFHSTGGSQEFFQIICEREKQFLQQLMAGHPHPFTLED